MFFKNNSNALLYRNIYFLYVIKASKWFMLIMPVVVLFYESNGLGLQEVFLLKAVYSISIVALEIPSGYMADRFGYRRTLLYGTILGFAGFVVYSFYSNFYGFLVAEIVLGLGQSLVSGADSAMLYDTLTSLKKEDTYTMQEGRVTSIGNFAEAMGGVAGGFLAGFSLRWPYYGQVFIALLAVPAAFLLVEPQRKIIKTSRTFGMIVFVVKQQFKLKKLRLMLLFSSITGTATLTFAWFVQPYFIALDIPVELFGVLWTALNLTVGVVSMRSHKIQKRLSKTVLFVAFAIMFPLIYIILGLSMSIWAIALIFMFYILRGVATPVLKDYMQQLIDPEVRATVLSVRNFIIRILFSITGPIFGYLSDSFSLSVAIITAGCILFLSYAVLLFAYFKQIKND